MGMDEVEQALWGTGRYKRTATSFGLQLFFYLGDDDMVHTLSPYQEVNGKLIAPYDGDLFVLSHRRMREICRLAEEAEREIRGATEEVERLPSDKYEYKEDHADRFNHLKWEVDGVPLCEEQIDAIKLILTTDKRVTVLTGPAGTGKSFITRWFAENGLATIAATTGKVAIADGGVTVDSLFCLDRGKWQVFNWTVLERYMKACRSLIFIDEASMSGHNMCDLILNIAEKMNKRLVLVGDFAQAAPVKDTWGYKSRMFQDINFICLAECHRQDESVFLRVLNKVRRGVVDEDVSQVLSARVGPCPDGEGWIRMFATNALADGYNDKRLADHCRETGQQPFTVFTYFQDMRSKSLQERRPRDNAFITQAIENAPYAHVRQLAVGAQVLFCANDVSKEDRQFANGDTGVLKDVGFYVEKWRLEPESERPEVVVSKAPPRVESPSPMTPSKAEVEGLQLVWLSAVPEERKEVIMTALSIPGRVSCMEVTLDRTESPIVVHRQTREVKSGADTVIHTVSGFPLRLGWACTIHKSQGMTVDKAWFDVASIRNMPETGRHGLAYVGLSRVRTLEGLLISEWVPEVVYCDPEVKHLI